MIGLMEQPELSYEARYALHSGLYDEICLHDGLPQASDAAATAFIRAQLRMVGSQFSSPCDRQLIENLVGTYFPNILGLESVQTKRTAAVVFVGHEAERAAAKRALVKHPQKKDAEPLLRWLGR